MFQNVIGALKEDVLKNIFKILMMYRVRKVSISDEILSQPALAKPVIQDTVYVNREISTRLLAMISLLCN